MAKYKKMSDADILATLDRAIADASKDADSTLSKERQLVLDYYNCKKPAPQHVGNSKYISADVYDTVESSKAALLETFAAGYKIVNFDPAGPEDVQDAQTASEYVDYVVFRQNDGYGVFHDVIHDGLMGRVGVAKVYWDACYYDHDEDFDGVTVDQLDAILAQDDVSLKEQPTENPDGTLSGTIVRKINQSKVCIDPIPLEEFLIAADAKDASLKTFKAHRLKKTVSDLKKMGVPQSVIDDIPSEDIQPSLDELARLGDIGDSVGIESELQDQVREVTVYECYCELDIEGTGEAQCYKITKVGSYIIGEPEVILEDPFVTYVPLPLPHQFFGNNFAYKVIPIQNARTVLMRGILDHTVITNNPRTMVVKGALVNPREMTDNRLGGVVNITRPDGVLPFPQANLNPFVFQTIQLLDEDKEDTTGISKLSQGLNKDAVSKQNAQGMVEQLVTLSQQRQKIMARNFAYKFIVPLWLKVYRLVLENEDRKKIFEVAGQFKEVSPKDWVERKDVYVSLHLGYGEQDREAAKFLGIHQLLSQDPSFKTMYGPKQKFNSIKAFLEHKGVKNVGDFIMAPEVAPKPEPDPMMVAELEQAKATTEKLKVDTQLAQAQFAHDAKLAEMEHSLKRMVKMIDVMVEQRDLERKEFEAKSRDEIAHDELDMIKANPPTETKETQIVSPNS